MTHAITIDDLSYRAGQHFAIRDLRMRVPNGSVYGFLGPNGSGKTTTLRLLLGMLPPADGTITVLGHEIPRGAHRASACGSRRPSPSGSRDGSCGNRTSGSTS